MEQKQVGIWVCEASFEDAKKEYEWEITVDENGKFHVGGSAADVIEETPWSSGFSTLMEACIWIELAEATSGIWEDEDE